MVMPCARRMRPSPQERLKAPPRSNTITGCAPRLKTQTSSSASTATAVASTKLHPSGSVPPLVPSAAMRAYHHAAIADAVARHAGEAVAVVIADDAYHAADGADAVRVTWEPRPAAASVERALVPGAPRVFDDWPDNVAGVARSAVGDVARGFAEADVVVEAALDFPRVAGVPIEPRGVVAHPATPDGLFTVWSSTQVPYSVRGAVAAALGLGESRVRVLAPDVGGGFGIKGHPYAEEVLIAVVARRLGRPVKWIETRREHFLTAATDRDQRHRERLGARTDGTLTAIETRFTRDHGAYPTLGDVIGLNTINHLAGPYRVLHFAGECVNVVTHKTFMGAYRGAGRPEAAFVLDRLLDRAARRLGLDPAELRRRNLIRKEAMPYRPGHAYRDGVAITYDPADYVAAFDRALLLLDSERWCAERDRRRGTARPVGVGLSAYLEGTGARTSPAHRIAASPSARSPAARRAAAGWPPRARPVCTRACSSTPRR